MTSNIKIRSKILKKRTRLSNDEIIDGSRRIANILEIIINRLGTKDILCFYPLEKEVNLIDLYDKLLKKGHNLFFPVSFEEEIKFYKVNDLSEFEVGKFNVLEPKNRDVMFLDKEAVVICPGLAFDKKNNRIGYGKGYYDRFLQKHKNTTPIGVCFGFQMVDELDVGYWDVPMEMIITDTVLKR